VWARQNETKHAQRPFNEKREVNV